MSTPETPETPRTPARGPSRQALSSALTAATLAVLLPLGVLAGLLSTLGAGWLVRYWESGWPVPLLSSAGLLVFLALLYGAGRLCAWGSRRPSAAVAFALGFALALIAAVGYLPGGDIVLQGHLMHNAYMFGTMLVLVMSVVRSGVLTFPGTPVAPAVASAGADAAPRTRPAE